MTGLTTEQLDHYKNKGYISPVNALTSSEANEIREEIEKIEKDWPKALEGINRNYIHLISPLFNKVCLNKKILDAVESIIGKNILICGTTLFIKDPNEKGFVSFHQDAKYIGLEPYNWVTVWLSVTDVNEKNGCMRMLPGSHKEILKVHEQNFDENNLLTRGQTIKNVPLEKTDPIILKAGQVSLHHPKIVHGSGLNYSNDRRIGFVIQSYIGTDVNQVIGKMYVQKARGEDNYKYHEYSNIPHELMGKNEVISQNKANEELSKIFYSGSKKIGKF
ncbi:MAG: phytanoyl-CoA dioxygenase family protein [Flavobacteriaceae bacterium]|jgi:non-haem Fe2+, alpha-ketoglutarate-dependent halogenase|nr:phytanoyl-CoA dioxygenase family protein [Flavobacteriaceae bacterium]